MDMNLPEECLQRWKALFLAELDMNCIIYCTVGRTTDESPMWIQYRTIEDTKTNDGNRFCFKFSNSQREAIFFHVPLEDEEFDLFAYKNMFASQLYDFFRDAKYDFIKTHYPTVFSDLK
jgi:hypothetical protein